MKSRGITAAAVALILIAIAAVVAVSGLPKSTTLSFNVVDEISGGWVWDLDARLQGRAINGYFQSDTKPLPGFTFTRLDRGDYVLELSAPYYLPREIPVSLKRGANAISEPIEMTGIAIPDVDQIYVFEKIQGPNILCELRPVNGLGLAIENHPTLDIWVGCEISVQMKDGAPITEPSQEASTRGDSLFKGVLDWRWDAKPETLFRYSAMVPGGEIKTHPASFVVIDYLIAVRDPRKMTETEMETILDEVWELSEEGDFLSLLEQYEGITFFIDTTWNFERG